MPIVSNVLLSKSGDDGVTMTRGIRWCWQPLIIAHRQSRQNGRFLLDEARAEFGSWFGDRAVLFMNSTAPPDEGLKMVTYTKCKIKSSCCVTTSTPTRAGPEFWAGLIGPFGFSQNNYKR